MLSYKRYTLWLLALVFLKVTIPLLVLVYLEPVSGDLIKYGFAENAYGWRSPQVNLKATPPGVLEEYQSYSDAIVLGDSFSFYGTPQGLNSPWQTLFTAETGLSISTFDIYKKKTIPLQHNKDFILNLVNSASFKQHPPKVFVVEVIERHLDILADVGGSCKFENPLKGFSIPSYIPKPELLEYTDVMRDQAPPVTHIHMPFQESMDYVQRFILIHTGLNGKTRTIAIEAALKRNQLFSNTKSDTLLFYENDYYKINWYEKKFDTIRCKLINLQNLVQRNGHTLFVIMLVPDKLTVYAPFLKDPKYSEISLLNKLYMSSPELHFIKLDQALQSVVQEGGVDVYLPNDTHWGHLGHKTAAHQLAQYLHEFGEDKF